MVKKKIEKLLDLSELNDGYVSVAEAKRKGIPQTYLALAEESGIFAKAAKGLYVKKGTPIDPFYILHFRYKKAVFSLRSALFLQGVLREMPQTLDVYLPRNYMTQGIEGVSCMHVSQGRYLLGLVLAVSPHGPLVPTYDLERTILDIVASPEDFSEEEYLAILDHLPKERIDKEKLSTYARELGMEKEARCALYGRI